MSCNCDICGRTIFMDMDGVCFECWDKLMDVYAEKHQHAQPTDPTPEGTS